ncbi:uncharacterized protein LOC124311857 [Daphnia pulicaria]|uniref:uncharacterized protein LOC124311857 n=1 Tax=Daphnia pulicaria TaxID=35523 RepID=UPI001EEC0A5D|nr:uncharacterized protein LOC124311857 [Daphnia pulicaria]
MLPTYTRCQRTLFRNSIRKYHTLTQHLVLFGSLVCLYYLYFPGGLSLDLMKPVLSMNAAIENQVNKSTIGKSKTITISTTITTNMSATELKFKSTCSMAADHRGFHQNVIGYSIYGDFSDSNFYGQYLSVFSETLRTIPIRYPGWVVRIYHNITMENVESWTILNNILDLGHHIDLCNATQIIKNRELSDIFAMTWRWLPLLDDMVDSFMSRDTDSLIIHREVDAVHEWLASNTTFHIMRDHPYHDWFFIGCCWGVKIHQERSAIVAAAKKMFYENHLHQYNYDQTLLIRYYQSIAVKSMVCIK